MRRTNAFEPKSIAVFAMPFSHITIIYICYRDVLEQRAMYVYAPGKCLMFVLVADVDPTTLLTETKTAHMRLSLVIF